MPHFLNTLVTAAAPRVVETRPTDAEGVHAILYEGLPWRGKPTRVFAYLGVPAMPSGERVPGMVLVHGGGGSAFIPWVQLWLRRGYAAIAMDTCGCVSGGGHQNHSRHDHGGPAGWGGFDQVDWPVEDQWPYHAVADVVRGHSLLRSLPEVDPDRVGLTGVSWGGYLACITAGIDPRLAFAAAVYGCGFLGANSTWLGDLEKLGTERAQRWLSLWDPSQYLPRVRCPMLWVSGTNDFAYPMDSWQQSYRLPSTPRTLSLQVRMPHGHGGPGENPSEIHVFAESHVRGGLPLPCITGATRHGRQLMVTFETHTPVVRAELAWTRDAGPWLDRHWEVEPVPFEPAKNRLFVELPERARVAYVNLVDDRNCTVSTEHMIL